MASSELFCGSGNIPIYPLSHTTQERGHHPSWQDLPCFRALNKGQGTPSSARMCGDVLTTQRTPMTNTVYSQFSFIRTPRFRFLAKGSAIQANPPTPPRPMHPCHALIGATLQGPSPWAHMPGHTLKMKGGGLRGCFNRIVHRTAPHTPCTLVDVSFTNILYPYFRQGSSGLRG